MVNSVVLVGRLTGDPEMRYTPSGVAVTSFRIAVNRPPRRDAPEGQAQQEADFINIVAWRQQAEFCGNYLDKGTLVSVEGSIRVRNWETQDGQRRTSVEVHAYRVHALETRAQREARRAAAGAAAEAAPPPSDLLPPPPPEDDFFSDQ